MKALDIFSVCGPYLQIQLVTWWHMLCRHSIAYNCRHITLMTAEVILPM